MNCACIHTGTAGIPIVQADTAITLPPGSGSADLQAAINGAVSGDVIILSDNMYFLSAVTIPLGMAITIQSSLGNNWVMTQSVPGFRHFEVLGSLLLNNITLDGFVTGNPGGIMRGGVQVYPSGAFHMMAASVIRNCYAGNGGGVNVNGGSMYLEGGRIVSNSAGAGGGVYVTAGGTLNMLGGAISSNASTYGGGVYLNLGSLGTMAGGVIGGSSDLDANNASDYAGGVAVYRGSRFVLDGGFIEGNRVVNNYGGNGGGGAYVVDSSVFELRSGAIRNNFVSAGASYPSFGGGIMLGELTYVVPPGLAPTSTLLMSGGVIEGNGASYRGGGVSIVANCNFTMTGGSIRGNTANTNTNGGGGGVHIGAVLQNTGVTFTMDGGEITENTGFMGGGVLVLGSASNPNYFARFAMNGGEITSNESATIYGGGVCVLNLSGEFIMGAPVFGFTPPVLSGNRANTHGGGVYTNTTCIINGANISSNTAVNGNGGGVYVAAAGTLSASGASFIAGNDAPNGNGGGIYTENFDYEDPINPAAYANIATAPNTVFVGNAALAAYAPPTNASSFINLGYAATSIRDTTGYLHPLNNYDINYVGAAELALYSVAYMANGGAGGYMVANLVGGSTYTLLPVAETGISRAGYTFAEWNTSADGTGTAYFPVETITILGDVILYAQWAAIETPGEIPSCTPCCTPCCKAPSRPCCKLCGRRPCTFLCSPTYSIKKQNSLIQGSSIPQHRI